MSEHQKSDNFFQQRWLPLLFVILGVALLWSGHQEYQQFQTEIADYVTARPDNRTVWLIIFGIASTVGGAVGLLRGKALK